MPSLEFILSVLGIACKAASTTASCYNYYDRHRNATFSKVVDRAPDVVGGVEGLDWHLEPVYYQSTKETCESALARGEIVHWLRMAGPKPFYRSGEQRAVRFDYRYNGRGCIAWMTI